MFDDKANHAQIENLLFIIEIVQFKRYIKENENDCSSILGEYLSIPQHEDLPKFETKNAGNSSVDMDGLEPLDGSMSEMMKDQLQTKSSNVDVYMYGLYIVRKYIRFSSSHEINIPGRVRKQILDQAMDHDKYRKLELKELQVIFDDAFVEILALLQAPLSRFSSWEEFNSYLKAIGPTAYPFFPSCRDIWRCCRCCCCCGAHRKALDAVQLLNDNSSLKSR